MKILYILNIMLEPNVNIQKSQVLLSGDAGTAKTANIML